MTRPERYLTTLTATLARPICVPPDDAVTTNVTLLPTVRRDVEVTTAMNERARRE